MAALILKAEIATSVFTRSISESRIPDDFPEVVQHKYLRPILGEDFYNALVAAPASYTDLMLYVKPVLFWYAKYMLLPEFQYEISDLGAHTIQINNTTPLSDEAFARVHNQTLMVAEEKVKMLNEYLSDNMDLYPLYFKSKNASEKYQIRGGIVMKKSMTTDYEDSPEKWI